MPTQRAPPAQSAWFGWRVHESWSSSQPSIVQPERSSQSGGRPGRQRPSTQRSTPEQKRPSSQTASDVQEEEVTGIPTHAPSMH